MSLSMDLNLVNLVNVLALSGAVERGELQTNAERILKEWEILPNFHYLLQTIYLDHSLPLQTRWLSIILFKNGVDKYWRLTRKSCITKEEKTAIRGRLFDSIEEQNNQLAIQNAHSIAKICRFDFPQEWPTFFDDFEKILTLSIRTNEIIKLNNLLLFLNQIVKMLASVKIGRTRAAMQLKTPSLTPILIKLYSNCFNSWTKTLDFAMMEVGYLCLKNLRRIIIDGFEYQNRDEHVVEFFQMSIDHFKKLIIEYDNDQLDILAKYLKCYNKLYLNIVDSNPSSFILIPSSLDILNVLLSLLDTKLSTIYESEEDEFWQQLGIQIILILKKLLNFSQKKGAITMKLRDDKGDIESSIQLLQLKIFNEESVKGIVTLLINWYLKLKPLDLESWNVEPEEWVNEQANSSWEYQLRPCCENFFQNLTESFPVLLSGFVLDQISQKLAISSDMLTKDSILAAFQLSSLSISSNVDFDQLLLETFIPEALKNDSIESKILKRRILLIIQEWISIKCSEASRIEIYKLYLSLLQSSVEVNDTVVKLTTCQSLKKTIEDWDFNKNDFKPFLNDFLNSIFQMLGNVQLSETKSFILELLSVLITQTTPLVPLETLSELLGMIPGLWDFSNNSNEIILKQSLIRLLNNLVIALNSESIRSFNISLPLLSVCCDENSEFYQLLSEDGFDLWNSIVMHFPIGINELPADLITKMPILIDGLLNSTEILATILKIVRGYALIDPTSFNNDSFGVRFMDISLSYLNQYRDDCLLIFLSTLEILVLEQKSTELFSKLVEVEFFEKLLIYITSEEISTTQNSNKVLLIISRLFYQNETLAMSIFHSQDSFSSFLKLWVSRISTNSEPRNKKIFILGLLSVFKLISQQSDDAILKSLGSFIQLVTQFLEETNETDQGDCEAYQTGFLFEEYNYSFDESSAQSGERLRVSRLYTQLDPVHHVNVKSLFKDLLLHLKDSNSQAFEKLMGFCIDVATLDQLKLLIL